LSGPLIARRYPVKPRLAKPSSIIARIGGSGAAPSIAKSVRRSIRDGLPRTRKKEGAYPFAPLSLASAGCLNWRGRRAIAGRRKKGSRPRGGKKSNPRGVPPSPPTAGCVKTPWNFHTLLVSACFRGLRSIRSRKIAEKFSSARSFAFFRRLFTRPATDALSPAQSWAAQTLGTSVQFSRPFSAGRVGPPWRPAAPSPRR
jgi:hypothetical protein